MTASTTTAALTPATQERYLHGVAGHYGVECMRDAEFIAFARTALPELAAHLRRAMAVVEAARAVNPLAEYPAGLEPYGRDLADAIRAFNDAAGKSR